MGKTKTNMLGAASIRWRLGGGVREATVMKCARWIAPVLGVLVIGVCASAGLGAEGISWHESLDDALAAAKKNDKLVLVDFYAEWCEPCKMLEHETFPAPAVIQAARAYECTRVDVDQHPELAMRYGVTGIPNILFLDRAGEPLHSSVGFYPPAPFADVLVTAAALGSRAAALKERPDDPRANYDAAMAYLSLQRTDEAQPLFENVLRTARTGNTRDVQARREASDLRTGAQIGRDACLAVGEKPRRAVKRLERALKRDPRSEHAALVKWHIARGYFALDDFERSLQCGRQLVRQYGDSQWAERAKPLIERAEQLAA
jgi:thiol-disulfide isomerase/thioredoxin